MTFSTTPRSRSPVLSICTRSENEEVLRAEIEAATTQQQKYKRHKTKHLVEPTIEEESDTEDIDHDQTCSKCLDLSHAQECHSHRAARRSFSSSLQGITGTVRDEFSIAKRFLKNTSLRQFNRMRSKSTAPTTTPQRRRPHVEDVDLESMYKCPSQPVELSSDPLYQLEDNQRVSLQSDDFRMDIPTFPDYQKVIPGMMMEHHLTDEDNNCKAGDLSSKKYSCDNCQQPICGGDLYDFCSLCTPSDRILCITCARQGRCQRHRSQRLSLEDMSTARSSPAPPYTHPSQICASKIENVTGSRSDATDHTEGRPNSAMHDNPRSGAGSTSLHGATQESELLMQSLKKLLDPQTSPALESRERSLQGRETSLREQLAAIREERMAVKEQELLVREREQLSRERDAMVIRNLQTMVTIHEMTRNGFIGSQFPSTKKCDDDSPQSTHEHIKKAQSYHKNEAISLENLGLNHKPKNAVAEVVAQAEATINDLVLDEKHVRTHPGQKRKKDGGANGSDLNTASHSSTAGRSKSSRQQSQQGLNEDDEDEGDEIIQPKKQKQDPSDPESPQRIFACPYFKHDRVRYSPRNLTEKHYRGCAGHFLHDIPRLKQHLRRTHWRPEHHCPRCFEVFSGPGQLTEHFEQVVACSKQECPFPEKMDKAKRQQIHVKRPKVLPETLWYDIYKVLFPGSPLPESPYAEEEEITPPSSAAPSSASPEEAAQRMIQILNERLDKHSSEPGYGLLKSSEFRKLLDSEIAGSMSELFNNISLDSAAPLDAAESHAPSIIVSPVTPPLADSSLLPSMELGGKHGSSMESRQANHIRSMRQPAPLLKEPKLHLSPALRDPATVTLPNMHHNFDFNLATGSQESQEPWQPPIGGADDMNMPSPQTSAAVQAAQIERLVMNFPNVPPIDNGYDDQSGSYQEGDDRQAMETMIHSCSGPGQGSTYLQAPKPVRPRNMQRFVPVRLETLDDSTSMAQQSGSQQLQPNKSVASLVDSGYGSGNSNHTGPRATWEDEDADMSDDISPLGHTSFLEELQLLQSSGGMHNNPWRSAEDPAYME